MRPGSPSRRDGDPALAAPRGGGPLAGCLPPPREGARLPLLRPDRRGRAYPGPVGFHASVPVCKMRPKRRNWRAWVPVGRGGQVAPSFLSPPQSPAQPCLPRPSLVPAARSPRRWWRGPLPGRPPLEPAPAFLCGELPTTPAPAGTAPRLSSRGRARRPEAPPRLAPSRLCLATDPARAPLL